MLTIISPYVTCLSKYFEVNYSNFQGQNSLNRFSRYVTYTAILHKHVYVTHLKKGNYILSLHNNPQLSIFH